MARLDDDETTTVIVDTPGGRQLVCAISESGLYTLIIKSRKAAAKRFRKWVTSEVLPAIRRTGGYGAPAAPLDLTDTATLHRLLLDHTGRTLAADERVAELEPKAAAMDRLAATFGSLCITDAAKGLGAPPRRLFAWLEANRWIYRRTSDGPWIAMEAKRQAGFVEQKLHRQPRQFGPDKMRERVLVTAKGMARLAELRAGL